MLIVYELVLPCGVYFLVFVILQSCGELKQQSHCHIRHFGCCWFHHLCAVSEVQDEVLGKTSRYEAALGMQYDSELISLMSVK